MKLTRQQAACISRETGAKAISRKAAESTGLSDLFGDQTLFTDESRLLVFEPVTRPFRDERPLFPIQVARIEPGKAKGEVLLKFIPPRPGGVAIDLAA